MVYIYGTVLRRKNIISLFFYKKSRLASLLRVSAVLDHGSPEGGELSLSACLGVGTRPPRNKKMANHGGHARGGGDGNR